MSIDSNYLATKVNDSEVRSELKLGAVSGNGWYIFTFIYNGFEPVLSAVETHGTLTPIYVEDGTPVAGVEELAPMNDFEASVMAQDDGFTNRLIEKMPEIIQLVGEGMCSALQKHIARSDL